MLQKPVQDCILCEIDRHDSRRRVDRTDIYFVQCECIRSPLGKLCDMHCKSSERHRLGMGLPVQPACRHTLKDSACESHFFFKFGKRKVSDQHSGLSCSAMRLRDSADTCL